MRSCLLAYLIVVVGSLTGCNSITSVTDLDGAGPSTSDDGNQADPANVPANDALPDFSAADVNPASARYEQDVSPRDYLGQTSAWYFGHST